MIINHNSLSIKRQNPPFVAESKKGHRGAWQLSMVDAVNAIVVDSNRSRVSHKRLSGAAALDKQLARVR
jgi:cell division septal protein FtsQ